MTQMDPDNLESSGITAPGDTAPAQLDAEKARVKRLELRARALEAEKSLATARSPWWRRADPLVLAIFAGALTLLGNMAVAYLNNRSSLAQEQTKVKDDLTLEREKARYSLVLQAMATNDATTAERNIRFFIDAGLLEDADCRIRDAIDQDQPVLPALSAVIPSMPSGAHSAPEIAALYDFPPTLDGRGQTIGILEFGGGVLLTDLTQYFKTLSLPTPDVRVIEIDGAQENPNDFDSDDQVMLDLEIAGSIAPRAHMNVYFAPFTGKGFSDAVKRAASDNVSVLAIGWGQPEANWHEEDLRTIDGALQSAAEQGITVLVAAGDRGATYGATAKHSNIDFPASSPWVLAVGGTTLKAKYGRITSEVPWNDPAGQFATEGGVSEQFPRPDWQKAVTAPGADQKSGRAIPDVVASADPTFAIGIVVRGRITPVGGTSAAVPLWAGLVALMGQGLGRHIGYLNRLLYSEIGPSGALHTISRDCNGDASEQSPSWQPLAGWGSPDGTRLFAWFRAHLDALPPSSVKIVSCDVQSARMSDQTTAGK
jgi:subtilase family serine protease